jgi:CDP-diacylglycerol--glycerol-3-phosphate 3-phosphatidyltransferase
MTYTIPNLLTMFRVVLIPVFVVVYFMDWQYAHQMGAFIFWLAAVTDWLDGYLARRWEQTTAFGAFLDPVADKLLVCVALIMVTHTYATLWITVPAIILLAREIFVSALRDWMSQQGANDKVKVSMLGKIKTTAQMLALIGLLSGLESLMGFPLYWVTLGYGLLYVATILSLWSMWEYAKAGWSTLTQ